MKNKEGGGLEIERLSIWRTRFGRLPLPFSPLASKVEVADLLLFSRQKLAFNKSSLLSLNINLIRSR